MRCTSGKRFGEVVVRPARDDDLHLVLLQLLEQHPRAGRVPHAFAHDAVEDAHGTEPKSMRTPKVSQTCTAWLRIVSEPVPFPMTASRWEYPPTPRSI